MIREYRWPDGVHCPRCSAASVVCNGHDDRQKDRQRYLCKDCSFHFDDLTVTILAGCHQPLKIWVLCPYFMGLNLSNRQIAMELGLNESDVQAMTCAVREGITAVALAVQLEGGAGQGPRQAKFGGVDSGGKVEADKAYVVAGHKGHPAAVQKKAASGGAGGSREHRDAARWRKKNHRSSV